MALGLKGGTVVGLAVGMGVGLGLAVMAPSLFPRAAQAARPLLRRALYEGMGAYLRAREGLAEFGEFTEDLVAEVRADVMAERGGAASAAAAAAASAPASAPESDASESGAPETAAPEADAGEAETEAKG